MLCRKPYRHRKKSRPLGEGGIAVGDDGRGDFRARKLWSNRKLCHYAKGSPFGGAGAQRLRGFGPLKTKASATRFAGFLKRRLRMLFVLYVVNEKRPEVLRLQGV